MFTFCIKYSESAGRNCHFDQPPPKKTLKNTLHIILYICVCDEICCAIYQGDYFSHFYPMPCFVQFSKTSYALPFPAYTAT